MNDTSRHDHGASTAICECSHHWNVHAESNLTGPGAICHGYTGSATPGPLRQPCRCTGSWERCPCGQPRESDGCCDCRPERCDCHPVALPVNRDPDDVFNSAGKLIRPGWHVRYMAQDPLPTDYNDWGPPGSPRPVD